jgi:predicted transcriptional regulator
MSGMAITVRIPDELDRELERVAAEEHVSKHALLLRGARIVVDRAARRDQIDAGLDHVLSHDAELLGRLADA